MRVTLPGGNRGAWTARLRRCGGRALAERLGRRGRRNGDATAADLASRPTYPRWGGPTMARYAAPGTDGSVVSYKPRYDHFIGGEYVAPAGGQYFENPTPVTGEAFTEVARGTADD